MSLNIKDPELIERIRNSAATHYRVPHTELTFDTKKAHTEHSVQHCSNSQY